MGDSSEITFFFLSFSPRVLRRPTDSLAPRNMSLRCGLLCSSVFSWCSFPRISPLVSPLRYEMVGTVCWTRLFRSLTVPLLGSVASRCVVSPCIARHSLVLWFFVVSCGTGWASTSSDNIWPLFHHCMFLLNFNLFTQLYAQGQFSPSLIGWAYSSQIFNFGYCSEYAASSNLWNKWCLSPSDGWHACSRRCQLALDLTVRGTGFPHPPLHSPGDCNVVGGGLVFNLELLLLLYLEKHSQWICDFSLSFSWQKGDRPDDDPLSHAASRQKKRCLAMRHVSRWRSKEIRSYSSLRSNTKRAHGQVRGSCVKAA